MGSQESMTALSGSLKRLEEKEDLVLKTFHSLTTREMKVAVCCQESFVLEDNLRADAVSSQNTLRTRLTLCFSMLEGDIAAFVSLDMRSI